MHLGGIVHLAKKQENLYLQEDARGLPSHDRCPLHANIYLKLINSLKRKQGRGWQEIRVLLKPIRAESVHQQKNRDCVTDKS